MNMVHVVPKKGGIMVEENLKGEVVPKCIQTSSRRCIDYRNLNVVTCKDHFPLQFIYQMLDRLTGKPHFFFLDGFSGYNLNPNAVEDQEKMAFTCLLGTFAFWRMSYISCNAPGIFQRLVMSIFSYIIGTCIEVSMDDFVVHGARRLLMNGRTP